MLRLLTKKGTIACAVAASLSGIATEASAARFGTYCQGAFQNDWVAPLSEIPTTCGWFNDELDDTDQKVFYYNLVGKKPYLESGGDHQPNNDSADDVDLLFIDTHGGVGISGGNHFAGMAMWNQNTDAISTNMRLGDSAWWGGGLAILAAYACHQLQHDNYTWNRWHTAIEGGPKFVRVPGRHSRYARDSEQTTPAWAATVKPAGGQGSSIRMWAFRSRW